MNEDFRGYRGGRIEVYDRKAKSGYAVYEARWLVPEEMADEFIEVFDMKKTDKMPYLKWDFSETLGRKGGK